MQKHDRCAVGRTICPDVETQIADCDLGEGTKHLDSEIVGTAALAHGRVFVIGERPAILADTMQPAGRIATGVTPGFEITHIPSMRYRAVGTRGQQSV